MYADWTNQMEQLIRYFGAFVLLFLMAPKLLFRRMAGDITERLTIRFMMMTLLLILLGYALVIVKLYEMLAIVPLLTLYAGRSYILYFIRFKKRRSMASPQSIVRFYDWLEGKYNPWIDIKVLLRRKLKDSIRALNARVQQVPTMLETIVLVVVLLISGWIRFYDALTHAAPALSDGYVTLAWIKYIDSRVLFNDGIYPQGFHIWMDYLVKFAATDPLYILKYTGPLNVIMLMAGMYLAVSRWTGSRSAGILSIAVFGLLGEYVSGGAYDRQASTNSQEFAFIFIIPTLYFLHRWLRDRNRWALTASITGMIVVGLIHTLAYIFLGLGVAILLFMYIPLTMSERFRPLWPVVWGGLASVGISVAPLGIGLIIGRSFHSSSEDFATSRNQLTNLKELNLTDYVVLIAVGIILIWAIRKWRFIRPHTGPIFVGAFVLATFCIYYFGDLFTFPGSTVITSRSAELWSIVTPLAIGTAAGLLIRGMERLRSRWSSYYGIGVVTLAVAAILLSVPPKPIIPYKMEWNSGVEQYLKISNHYRPKTWMIVSHALEGYSIVFGNGYHYDLPVFLDSYSPNNFPLVNEGIDGEKNLTSRDVFIYYQKEIFKLDETYSIYSIMKPEYEQREKEMKRLDQWIQMHQKVNKDLSIWYEDDKLRIYHIHQPEDEKDRLVQIWGEGADAK